MIARRIFNDLYILPHFCRSINTASFIVVTTPIKQISRPSLYCLSTNLSPNYIHPLIATQNQFNRTDIMERESRGESSVSRMSTEVTGPESWDPSILDHWRDGRGQKRSPCPFLNTAANHGLIDYSGDNISINQLRHVLKLMGLCGPILDFLINTARHFARPGQDKIGDQHPLVLDLMQTAEHNFVEHDASLTRLRYTHEDRDRAIPRNKERIDGLISCAEDGYITYNSVSRWRARVRRMEEKDNLMPPFNFPIKQRLIAAGEAVALLEIIGENGKLPIEAAREFLEKERFPKNYDPPLPGAVSSTYFIWKTMRTFLNDQLAYYLG